MGSLLHFLGDAVGHGAVEEGVELGLGLARGAPLLAAELALLLAETAVGGLSVKATCTCCNATRLTCSTRLC